LLGLFATNEVSAPVLGRDEAAMEVMHAKECDTLHAQIDRLQTYAARLVVHNDYLLRLHPLQSVEEEPATPRGFSLPEIPPPWHHPEPAPPPEGSLVPEKLQLQANVLIEKLALLEHTSRQASDTLKDVCQRAAASAWAPSGFRRLAREVEPSIRAEGEALTVLSKTPTAMRAEVRADDTDEGVDEEAKLLIESLRELLRCSAVMATHGAQLVQVGAILEVAAAALGTAVIKMDRDREELRAARRALTRRMDLFWSPANDVGAGKKTSRRRVRTGSKRSRDDEYTDEGYASDYDTTP